MVPMFRLLDHLFYGRETRQLRGNLQSLLRQAGEGSGLETNLAKALEAVCAPRHAIYGLILIFSPDSLSLAADYRWSGDIVTLQKEDLTADDAIHLPPGRFQSPWKNACWSPYGKLNNWADSGRPMNGLRLRTRMWQTCWLKGDRKSSRFAEKTESGSDRSTGGGQTALATGGSSIPIDTVEAALRNLTLRLPGRYRPGQLELVNTRLARDR
jgi:hypothetical protein